MTKIAEKVSDAELHKKRNLENKATFTVMLVDYHCLVPIVFSVPQCTICNHILLSAYL